MKASHSHALLAGLAIVFLVAGCGLPNSWPFPTPTLPATLSQTDTPKPLPDLIVNAMAIEPEKEAACYDSTFRLGVHIWIENAGEADAGPFVVEVNNVQKTIQVGLPAGGMTSLWFSGYEDINNAFVDATHLIDESDEANNRVSRQLPLPTPSPPCIQTPTPIVDIEEPSATLTGHTAKVLSLAFSPDGRLLASGSVDDTLRLWRVNEANLLRTMQGHPFPVLSLAFSPNGSTLVTGSYDGLIRIWQVSNGSLLHTLEGHAGRIYGVVFSPNSNNLASCSDDFTVRIWRASDGKLLDTIDEGMSAVLSLQYSPDGTTLAWGESNGTVRIWRTLDRKWLHIIQASDQAVTSVAFSADGSLLASGSMDGLIRIWRVSDASLLYTLQGHTDGVTSVAFSPTRNLLASGSLDDTLRLWEINSPPDTHDVSAILPKIVLVGHTAKVNSIAFSPNGKILASASDDKTIRLWSVPDQ